MRTSANIQWGWAKIAFWCFSPVLEKRWTSFKIVYQVFSTYSRSPVCVLLPLLMQTPIKSNTLNYLRRFDVWYENRKNSTAGHTTLSLRLNLSRGSVLGRLCLFFSDCGGFLQVHALWFKWIAKKWAYHLLISYIHKQMAPSLRTTDIVFVSCILTDMLL